MTDVVSDTFTEAADLALGSHTPEIGGTWVQHPNSTQGMTVNASAGKVQGNNASSTSLFYNSQTPGTADYKVEAVISPVSSPNLAGVLARVSTSAQTYYQAFLPTLVSGSITLQRVVAGSSVSLGVWPDSGDLPGWLNGIGYTINLSVSGSVIVLSVDGTARISANDNAGAITDLGYGGIRGRLGVRHDGFRVIVAAGSSQGVSTVETDSEFSVGYMIKNIVVT